MLQPQIFIKTSINNQLFAYNLSHMSLIRLQLTIIIQIIIIARQMLLPEQLYPYFPRKVQQWSSKDVQLWFKINCIDTKPTFSFQSQQLDGKMLLHITPNFLMETCGIGSRVIMKKIIQWLENDREEFQQLVEQRQNQYQCLTEMKERKMQFEEEPLQYSDQKDKENTPKNHLIQEKHEEAIKCFGSIKQWKKKKPLLPSQPIPLLIKQRSSVRQNSNSIKAEIQQQKVLPQGVNVIKSLYQICQNILEFECQGKVQYLNESGKIGRLNQNDILLVYDSISRKHAEVVKQKNEFYLRDVGSTCGTYLQIGAKVKPKIEVGDFLTFGSDDCQIQILGLKINKNGTFDMKVQKTDDQSILHFYNKKMVLIGREGKDICFKEDSIAVNHAKIILDKGEVRFIKEKGLTFRKLKPQQPCKLEQEKIMARFGLHIVTIQMLTNRKPIINISEFDSLYK